MSEQQNTNETKGQVKKRHHAERKKHRQEIEAMKRKRSKLSKKELEGHDARKEITLAIREIEEKFEARLAEELAFFDKPPAEQSGSFGSCNLESVDEGKEESPFYAAQVGFGTLK
mmetsp:Transcript_19323/g.21503  ORF Transcript_19323/g.21503 Transcript_19323/m.21503 type:complete len:115 (-) Transcript_19323:27-371(-)